MTKNLPLIDRPHSMRYHNAIAPIHLQFVAHTQGYQVGIDLEKPFVYCELGCGKALTLCMLASIYPQAQFIGIDANAANINYNRKFAKKLNLNNVRFSKKDISKIMKRDLPICDFIIAHGILSWVDDKTRLKLLKLLNRHLSDSGIAYLNYNVLPGLATIVPLHRMIQSLFRQNKSHDAMVLFRQLMDNHARFFNANPEAKQAVEQFTTNPDCGKTHFLREFFASCWHPFYVDEVNELLRKHQLFYICQSSLWANMDEICLPKDILPVIDNMAISDDKELVKDFVFNTHARADLFVKHVEHDLTLTAFKQYYCVPLYDHLPAKIMFHGNNYNLTCEILKSLYDSMKKQHLRVIDLLNHDNLKAIPPDKLMKSIKLLFALNIIAPSTKQNSTVTKKLKGQWCKVIHANMLPLALEEQLHFIPLISSTLSNAVMLSLDQAWILSNVIDNGSSSNQIKTKLLGAYEQMITKHPNFKEEKHIDVNQCLSHSLKHFENRTKPLLHRLAIIE